MGLLLDMLIVLNSSIVPALIIGKGGLYLGNEILSSVQRLLVGLLKLLHIEQLSPVLNVDLVVCLSNIGG